MSDLVEKARLGRANALSHLSGASRSGFASSRNATERRAVPLAFVSSRAKIGGNTGLI
jgi:hypothetical protein